MKNKYDLLLTGLIFCSIILSLPSNAQRINETAKLLPSDGESEAFFGNAVATNGEIAVIGAWFSDDMAGAAYIFRRDGTNWTEEEKLTPTNGSSYDFFGCSVSVYGDDVIVGAPGDNNKGAAYIFHFNGNNWTQTTKLTASNGATYDYYGSSVALSDNYAIVGASGAQSLEGAVYVYTKNGTSWQEAQILNGTLYSTSFGSAVDISGEAIVVGASASSYAFVFMLDGTTWVKVAELTDLNGSINDKFGKTVSIDGDLAVVGAPNHQNGNGATGAAYIYHRQGSNWVEEEKIVAEDGELDDHFGIVSLCGTTLVVGAYDDDDYGLDAGSAYLYCKEGDNWQFKDKLLASDGFAGDELGSSVAVFSDVIITGAPNDNDNGPSSGSAYIFDNNYPTDVFQPFASRSCQLHQNIPNPFVTATTIKFQIVNPGQTEIIIFDSYGKQVKVLLNEFTSEGEHQFCWDGTDENGNKVRAGNYFCQLKTGREVELISLIKCK